MGPAYNKLPFGLQLLKAAHAHEIRGWNIHGRSWPALMAAGVLCEHDGPRKDKEHHHAANPSRVAMHG
jgi:hypothetical protein